MGSDDKISNAGEEALGQVKEKAGDVTGNEDLEAQGIAEQAEANAKEAGEDIKDAADEAKDAAKDMFGR